MGIAFIMSDKSSYQERNKKIQEKMGKDLANLKKPFIIDKLRQIGCRWNVTTYKKLRVE